MSLELSNSNKDIVLAFLDASVGGDEDAMKNCCTRMCGS